MVWECVQWLVRNTSESIIMKLKKTDFTIN